MVDTYQIERTITRYIPFSSTWLTFPGIITEFLLPLLLGGLGLSYFLGYIFARMRFMTKFTFIKYVLGFSFAYAALSFILSFAPFITYVGALMIGFFKYPKWSWKKKIPFAIGLFILIAVLYGFVFPFVFSFMESLF